MESVLENLNQTPGITGSAIFSSSGDCLAFLLPQPYEPIIFSEILHHIDSLAAVNTSLNNSEVIKSLVISLENGSFILRKLDDSNLIVIVEPKINTSVMNVALTAAVLKLTKGNSKTALPTIKPLPSPQIMPRISPSPTRSMKTVDPQIINNSFEDNKPIPPDAVGKGFVNHLVKVSSTYLGSNTIEIFKGELQVLGASSKTLKRGQVADLIRALSNYISDINLRKEFTAVALGDKKPKK